MEASLPTSNPYLPGSMLIYRRVLMLILLFVISIFLTGQQEYAWSSTSNFSARCNTMFPRWSCGRSSERKRRNREEKSFPFRTTADRITQIPVGYPVGTFVDIRYLGFQHLHQVLSCIISHITSFWWLHTTHFLRQLMRSIDIGIGINKYRFQIIQYRQKS